MAKEMTMDSVVDNSLNIAHNMFDFLKSKKFMLDFNRMSLDYDKDADVLYISFRKPQRATKTIETDDDILIRKDGNKIVGITILHASKR